MNIWVSSWFNNGGTYDYSCKLLADHHSFAFEYEGCSECCWNGQVVLPNGQSWRSLVLSWIELARSTVNPKGTSASYFSGNRCSRGWKFWLKKSPRWYLHGSTLSQMLLAINIIQRHLKAFGGNSFFFFIHIQTTVEALALSKSRSPVCMHSNQLLSIHL